ncbi:MAG: tripartite tricarboxylate transporter substrate binding protein [Synergistaceae bacterium]|nr:tripartite tricarboxylate transporter substrate binding protein [Synergistaceae bacterium]MBQ7069444.1 tripartite tricarboxylate transporter substrate binding protein [Synergistaceae bacterium]MBR0076654.1 tripartite tricarboxylate transporter substrate binding protein [Synergistaceae bacterium]MBR0233536.1 tripartite tricarboxylate transporter substrate binding protein [Synergistaceae bacterium]MBR0254114.1 tripartite tricarboxylate transporter substrate binding protein [Synergistaceae bact
MKKVICTLLAVSFIFCGAMAASAEWKFERKISIVCPWGVGGGADSTLRPMANLIKEILGQEVEVVNVTGGNGVTAIEYVYKQPADGYTFMLGTQSLFMQDIQGTTSMNFKDEFVPVARLVHAINVITASKKAMEKKGYKTFSEMRDFVKEHPFEVSVGMLTSTGLDGASLKQALEGLDILDVSYPSGSEMNSALVGGHIDIMVTGTDEIEGLIAAGDIVPLLALCEKRMKRYPDVECSVELGINSVLGPARGIFAKKGTPKEAIDALVAAIEKASQDPSWQAFLVQGCYDERPGFANAEDYAKDCEADYKLLSDYLKSEGVMKKDYYSDAK